jgi:uncharacterized membrane protein
LENRTFGQKASDWITEFSGSWTFINWFTILGVLWILVNASHIASFDPFPFLALNSALTVISTLQSPLILMSQNRQNDRDRENMQLLHDKMDEILKNQKV